MTTPREAFLAGDRPDDVALFLADTGLQNAEALAERAERVDGGYVLVVDGRRGRRLFDRLFDRDLMAFARSATEREGRVDRDLGGATCPDGDDHDVRFVFAFAQERTPDAGGRYAEGDVIHAYAQCGCGTAFSDRWVANEE